MAYLIISNQNPKVGPRKKFSNPFDKGRYIEVINSYGFFVWEDETVIKNKTIEDYGAESYISNTTAYFRFDEKELQGKMKVIFGKFLIQIFVSRLSCEYLTIAYKLAGDLGSQLWMQNKKIDDQGIIELKRKYC